ncbi:MAG: protein kinase [Candidatus Saccharimonas sp.]|nr:protein kinase [Planctomycetaceae bacterium]
MSLTCLNAIAESSFDQLGRFEDTTLRRRVMIKQLTPDGLQQDVCRERLLAEAGFLTEVQHTGSFLKLLNRDDAEGQLVYEDVQCSLEQLIARHGPLENDLVTNVLLQVVDGLATLHGRGLAHGSLTAKKIFVDPQGRVKMGDVLPYRHASEKPVSDRSRRAKYQAPEVLDTFFGDCGPLSDLYCVGFLLLEMLTGPQFPNLFGMSVEQAASSPKWLQWHADPHRTLDGWRGPNTHVSTALADVIDRLIVKTARQRQFSSAVEIREHVLKLGLHSNRTLPMYEVAAAVPPVLQRQFCPPKRMAAPVLILTARPGDGKCGRFATRRPVIVGRDPDAAVSLCDERSEFRHAVLACQRTAWYVYDLQSATGTFRNQSRIKGVGGPLLKGDVLSFGDSSYLVDLEMRGTSLIPIFDLQQRVHSGENGEVYRAIWCRPGGSLTVAVRLLPGDYGEKADSIRRLLRSVDESKKLVHPNIVRLCKAGMVRSRRRDTWYLATEFMTGGSLRDKLAKAPRHRLSRHKVRQFGLEIATALLESERRGLLHRNINPACILFTMGKVLTDAGAKIREVAKLGDFLLLRPEEIETLHQITHGKLGLGDYTYQSPEQILGMQQLRITTDLFSLAACMYEAVAGRLPIEPDQPLTETITTLHSLDWPPPSRFAPDIQPDWDEFFAKALARDPSKRISNTTEFGEWLVTLSTDQRH